MTVHEDQATVVLVVRGPGEATASHEFQSLPALLVFAEDQERQLQEAGFHLQAVAERRSGQDRRQGSRDGGGPDRRRRTIHA